MNQTMLANHSTLLDLLEIPQLMDTYVKKDRHFITLLGLSRTNVLTYYDQHFLPLLEAL